MQKTEESEEPHSIEDKNEENERKGDRSFAEFSTSNDNGIDDIVDKVESQLPDSIEVNLLIIDAREILSRNFSSYNLIELLPY